MKSLHRQLCTELKTSKKLNCSASKFVIKVVGDSSLSINGSKLYQIYVVHDGLSMEYIPFVIQVYGRLESLTMYNV